MNRNRLILGLAVAVVIALVLSTFVYRVFKQASTVKPTAATGHIVVAAAPLQLGTRLDANNVEIDDLASRAAGGRHVDED